MTDDTPDFPEAKTAHDLFQDHGVARDLRDHLLELEAADVEDAERKLARVEDHVDNAAKGRLRRVILCEHQEVFPPGDLDADEWWTVDHSTWFEFEWIEGSPAVGLTEVGRASIEADRWRSPPCSDREEDEDDRAPADRVDVPEEVVARAD